MKRDFKTYIVPLLALLLAMPSCIHEYPPSKSNLEESVKVYFSFQNHYNPASADDLKEVKRVDLFVFDEQGNFVEQFTQNHLLQLDSTYYMGISLPYGSYHMVSWLGLSNSYHITPYPLTSLTHFEACMLSLLHNGEGVVEQNPSLLLYAAQHQVVINQPNVSLKFDLQQRTHTLTITTEGLPPSASAYSVEVTDTNGEYLFDGTLAPTAAALTYRADCSKDEQQQPFANLRVMHLSQSRRDPLLTLTDATTGNPLYQAKLVDLICKLKDKGVTVDFDAVHTYHIHLRFVNTQMDAQVSINGWNVSDTDTEIQI